MQTKNGPKHLIPIISLLLTCLLTLSLLPVRGTAATSVTVNVTSSDGVTHSVTIGSGSSTFPLNLTDNGDGSVSATRTTSKYSVAGEYPVITVSYTAPSNSAYKLSFTVTSTKASYSPIAAGETFQGSNTYEIAAGETLSLEARYQISRNTTGTIKISSITIEPIVPSPLIQIPTVEDCTITVNGSPIKDDWEDNADSVEVSVENSDANQTFLGWVGDDGKVYSTATSATIAPGKDAILRPVYTDGNDGYYMVTYTKNYEWDKLLGIISVWYYELAESAYLFTDLQQALDTSAATTFKVVVPLQDVTVPVRDNGEPYTIPTGVTLMIPYNSTGTMYPGQPVPSESYTTPTEYRTMTLAEGVEIIVNGSLNVSASHYQATGSKQNGGSPSGPCGFVRMKNGSKITVNSGGTLKALGFITGSGSVTANSGGAVYEMFQFMDFRGGSQTTAMQQNVFPLSQYYVQNIEVPVTIKQGAKELCYTTIYMSSLPFPTTVEFIGTDSGLFRLGENGQMVKRYDGATDRLIVEFSGNASVSNVILNFEDTEIDSADYVMPMNSNITINIVGEGTVVTTGQDLALLPGAQVTVEEGAAFIIGSGHSVYVYDSNEWDTYVGSTGSAKFMPINYAPGKTYTRTEADLVDASVCVNGIVDASAGYLYTTASNANIHSTGSGQVIMQTTASGYTYQQKGSSDATAIAVNSAYLKNYDGSYVSTMAATYTYCGTCGAWECSAYSHSTNVELGNSLNMYFAFWNDAITTDDGWRGYKVVISCAGNVQTLTFGSDSSGWMWTDANGDSVNDPAVAFENLAAKQMNDLVKVELYNGNELVTTWCDTIRDYSLRLLTKYSEDTSKQKLCTLLVDMLNYGAACQKAFNYNTNNLANAGLDGYSGSQDSIIPTEVEHNPSSTYFNGANLVTDSNIQFLVAFQNPPSGGKFSYSYVNHWRDGDIKGYTPNGEATKGEIEFVNGTTSYAIPKLFVADGREEITITVYGADRKELDSWTDCIECYCLRVMNSANATDAQKAACKAFIKFSHSAEIYLESEREDQL